MLVRSFAIRELGIANAKNSDAMIFFYLTLLSPCDLKIILNHYREANLCYNLFL